MRICTRLNRGGRRGDGSWVAGRGCTAERIASGAEPRLCWGSRGNFLHCFGLFEGNEVQLFVREKLRRHSVSGQEWQGKGVSPHFSQVLIAARD